MVIIDEHGEIQVMRYDSLTPSLTTSQLARAIGMQAESIRVHLCRRGSFYGIRPSKLLNGRLLWPADSVQRLLEPAERINNGGNGEQ